MAESESATPLIKRVDPVGAKMPKIVIPPNEKLRISDTGFAFGRVRGASIMVERPPFLQTLDRPILLPAHEFHIGEGDRASLNQLSNAGPGYISRGYKSAGPS